MLATPRKQLQQLREVTVPAPAAPPRTAPKGRVLLLLTNISPTGGAEVQSIQVALRLKQRGWDVRMASLLPVNYPLPILEEAGIRVVSANMAKGPRAALAVGSLVKLIRSYKPDIIHSHMAQAILAARLARLVTRTPVVIGTLHGLMMYSVSGHHQLWLERFHRVTDRLGDVTTVVCQSGLDYYYGAKTISAPRLRYVPNGVDTLDFRVDPVLRQRTREALQLGSDFVWLSVGRFDPIKDHRTMLHSFAGALRQQPNSLLLLAGGGALDHELRAQAAALNIENRIRFLGRRSDVAALMNGADAIILTSKFEALPLVLLEAGACGLPAVATNIGGNVEAVIENKTGYLAPVADAGALAEAMVRLSSLPPAERARMALEARRHVARHYQFETVMDQWETLYQEMLDRRGNWPA